jgi:hypothetical protein
MNKGVNAPVIDFSEDCPDEGRVDAFNKESNTLVELIRHLMIEDTERTKPSVVNRELKQLVHALDRLSESSRAHINFHAQMPWPHWDIIQKLRKLSEIEYIAEKSSGARRWLVTSAASIYENHEGVVDDDVVGGFVLYLEHLVDEIGTPERSRRFNARSMVKDYLRGFHPL